ncbi:Uncharacterized protein SCF082_LOCUS35673, partial [Durusdinium trenchii]
ATEDEVEEDGQYVSINVRTLSGVIYTMAQVDVQSTVRDLKVMIHKQNDTFEPDSQRLLKGRSELEDEKSIEECGIKNGDTVHLVKRLEQNDFESEFDQGPGVKVTGDKPGEEGLITVICPEGASAGGRLLINPPGREQMTVTIPRGVRPGDRFQVRLPPRGGGCEPCATAAEERRSQRSR